MDRVRRERDRFVGFVMETMEGIEDDHPLRGHARFVDDHRLQVDDHPVVDADRIIADAVERDARMEDEDVVAERKRRLQIRHTICEGGRPDIVAPRLLNDLNADERCTLKRLFRRQYLTPSESTATSLWRWSRISGTRALTGRRVYYYIMI